MDKTEDTTMVLTTDDDSLTTTSNDELTTESGTEDGYETVDLDEYDYSDLENYDYSSLKEYDYSDLKELWDKYYNDENDDELLYSTEKIIDTTGLAEAKSFVNTELFSTIYGFIASMFVVIIILNLLYTVYKIIVRYMIAKKMGRSTGFAIASIFFWPIMSGVLAFSKNKALENKSEAAPEPVETTRPEAPSAPVSPTKE